MVLPMSARRAAALALGVGIGLNGPLLAGTALAAPPAAMPGVATAGPAVPDWPVATSTAEPPTAGPVPDWPGSRTTGAHVVVRGDCLWTIAAGRLRADSGRTPTDAEAVTAVQAWWRANAGVIGPDPDLLLPGQVLEAPVAP
jgi:nucleoid-associated protein YgaU